MNAFARGLVARGFIAIGAIAALSAASNVAPAQRSAARSDSTGIVAENCLVTLMEERNVPAEEAGVLTKLRVKEGDEVQAFRRRDPRLTPRMLEKAGTKHADDEVQPLAEVDKSLPLLQRQVAYKEWLKADAEAKNPVSIDYAKKSSAVAKKAWDMGIDANRRSPDSIPRLEMDKLQLEFEASLLKTRQSEHEQNIAVLTANTKEAELANAEQAIEHRDIHSPLDGFVAQIYVHEGEWVKPGDPVFRIISLKQLRVETSLNVATTRPGDVVGREVSITTELANGEKATFTGRIVFVSQEIKTGGRYTVRAEVDNRRDAKGLYVLNPGMRANMAIDTQSPARAARTVINRSADK